MSSIWTPGGERPIPRNDQDTPAPNLADEERELTPEEMQARMRADIEKWGAVIEKAGLEKQ